MSRNDLANFSPRDRSRIREFIRQEREACAAIADAEKAAIGVPESTDELAYKKAAGRIAALIRKRSEALKSKPV